PSTRMEVAYQAPDTLEKATARAIQFDTAMFGSGRPFSNNSQFTKASSSKPKVPTSAELFAVYINEVKPTATDAIQPDVTTMIQKFTDVFPESLPNQLPPKRTVDHAIKLTPGAEPPSRAIYRMSYEETNELKKQLADLLKKGYVRPMADALSRPPHLANITSVSTYLTEETLKKGYHQDKYFAPIFEALKNLEKSDEKQKARAVHYELRNNKLYLKQGQQLAIPKNKELRT
ncbi:2002_t:CDS:2, partial [Entrophospora sp. SA101]